MKAVKLADIAKKLNTSTVTVSKALSDQKGVSDELRAKIKQLAHEMGYVSLSAKKNTQEKKSYNIGMLISEKFLDQQESFYWVLYQELAKETMYQGSFSMLEIVTDEDERAARLPKLVQENKVDGLIVVGIMKDEYLRMLNGRIRIPIVYTDFYDRKYIGEYVVTDNFYGEYLLTNYLIDMGHKDIAFIGTLLATTSITDRCFGYIRALTERGIEVKRDHIIDDRYIDKGVFTEDFEFKFPEVMPTALVCNCDKTADIVVEELNRRGYRVPEDISVVGFDNYVFNQKSNIGFTTYEVNIKEIANTSVDIIIKKVAGEPYKSGYQVIPGRIVLRDSVKRLNIF